MKMKLERPATTRLMRVSQNEYKNIAHRIELNQTSVIWVCKSYRMGWDVCNAVTAHTAGPICLSRPAV